VTCLGCGAMTGSRSAVVATQSAALNAAMNRRSSIRLSTFESASYVPHSQEIFVSPGLIGSFLSQPYSTHFSKLILVPSKNTFCPLSTAFKKWFPLASFDLNPRRIYGRVDRAADTLLDCREP